MNDEKKQFLEHLASSSEADLDKVMQVEKQLEALERAGLSQKREYSLQRPLGQTTKLATFANAQIRGR